MESVGREAVKGEQYDIRRGIAPPTLTLETLIVPLMTPGAEVPAAPVAEPNIVEHLGVSSCKRPMHILIKSQDTFQPNKIAPSALTSETPIVLLGVAPTCPPPCQRVKTKMKTKSEDKAKDKDKDNDKHI